MSSLRDRDPQYLGRFRLEGRLGEGGQGVVYLGRSGEDEPVAVKVLGGSASPQDRERFLKEAENAKRVARFCTAQVLEVGEDDGRPFVVSEYVEGPTLQQHVDGGRRVTGAELERLAISMATALVSIHRVGVVHRDFKPANVILGSDGPRVIDFGIARTVGTMTSSVVGTPSFMAPEQWGGRQVGPASDVWAWAATVVFAARGSPPFGSGTIPELYARIAGQEPRIPAVGPPLQDLIAAALGKDLATRPTMRQVLDGLLDPGAAERRDTVPPSNLPRPSTPTVLRPVWNTMALGSPGRTRAAPSSRSSGFLVGVGAVLCAALIGAFALVLSVVGDREATKTASPSPSNKQPVGMAPAPSSTEGEKETLRVALKPGVHQFNRLFFNNDEFSITLSRAKVGPNRQATFYMTYRNVSGSDLNFACDDAPERDMLVSSGGATIRSIQNSCSVQGLTNWTFSANTTYESYTVFRIPDNFSQPLTLRWYPDTNIDGRITDIALS